jgi:hypothetical protein
LGDLYYGSQRTRVHLDDRVLHHLRVAITTKLRRGEPFLVSWRDAERVGGGRTSIWIAPHIDLIYKFDGVRDAETDPRLVESMLAAASTTQGIELDEATLVESPRNW